MAIRVLIVDDSRFICKRIQEILQEELDFEVVGTASNGREAVSMAIKTSPDVITMDVEMPVMDGITAVKKIMAENPLPILMLSASTQVGAEATLNALEAGAIDFLPKQLNEIDGNTEIAKRLLRRRVRLVAMQASKLKRLGVKKVSVGTFPTSTNSQFAGGIPQQQSQSIDLKKNIKLLVIIASTGGPVAIQKVLTQIPKDCSIPIILVQHMPSSFTHSFAERLNDLCEINVREAVDGDHLEPGLALLAPGGMQMQIMKSVGGKVVKLRNKEIGEIYSPCADTTLISIAQQYKGSVLAVVLTGMGSDGSKGAQELKQSGSNIWAQDEESCTIYGMPKAIVDANLADQVFSLNEIVTEFGKIF